ncbi:uncharacterized protein LOC110456032 isoform X2 [Mizuhopecten yessoensis]|uniref:uncharacterized protein LOC110456032 isoform X2 n=1 Tax=Mizuhopecten yessoensis TaxID=6573 RepID=UPI000B45EF09|nr:uncharacterized protein LOC110456032 isoform X2 [Mizuhopecten yessoensis]
MKKNGASSQDIMMNLLGDSSDSDPELLNLPPLKGKKPKKKKSFDSDRSVCNLWAFMKMFFVLLLICAVSVLMVISFWLSGQVADLKQRLLDIESRNQNGLGDYQDLRNKVQIVNQTIQGVKSGGDTQRDRMNQRLTNITNKIHQLSMTTDSLQEGLKAAPEIKQIAMKVPVVISTAAKLGVNVKSMQTTINDLLEFKKSTETELKTITESMSESVPTSSPGDSSSVDQNFREDTLDKFETMSQTLAFVNSSLWSKMDHLQQDFLQRQTKFMENATSFLKMKMQKTSDPDFVMSGGTPAPGGREGGNNEGMNEEFMDQMEAKVHDIVHQMIVDMELMNRTEADSKALDSLLTKMDNVTAIVKTLRDQFDKVQQDHASLGKSDQSEGVQGDQLSDLRQDTVTQIQAINKTVHNLLHDFGAVTGQYLTIHANQVKLTSTVDQLKNFLGAMDKKIKDLSASQEPVDTGESKVTTPIPQTKPPQQPPTEVVTKTPVTNPADQMTSNKNDTVVSPTPPDTTTLTQESGQSDIPTTPAPPPPPPQFPLVKIPNINNFQDLEMNFSRWDKDGNEHVAREDLDGFMPEIPSEELLKPYDMNNDGHYTLDEMAAAMGFTNPDQAQPTEESETNGQH